VSLHADRLRLLLAKGPAKPRQLAASLNVSQPTLSRALSSMGQEIVRIGGGPTIQYALRDAHRGLDHIPVYRVGTNGVVSTLGTLVPIRPEGFVMRQADGVNLVSEGLPWWLLDMRPQGFLGRAYALRHGADLGLPGNLADWSDTHALRALMLRGHDAVGNLLLGDLARERFINAQAPMPISAAAKAIEYLRLAREAVRGESPGSSAGGEQPKFAAFVETVQGPAHLLVKFSLPDDNPVTRRWRDLLLAEHHALQTLASAGIQAARSAVVDVAGQRFLEVERFDRLGYLGRRAVHSLTAVEAEFVGNATAPWPVITAHLAAQGHVTPDAAQLAALLFAFGTLIGNTDMHNGNLSFVSEQGRPYALAPAYDMLPMGLAPRSGGGLPDALPAPNLHPSVDGATWRQALVMAEQFFERLRADDLLSEAFAPALEALGQHLDAARARVARLG
jgi:hypothetical protein